MASGTEGNCAGCHSGTSSAKGLYSWLQGKGYVGGSSPALTDSNQSCLSWYGGNMPPSGPSDQKAVSDMNAWAAAGAQNN
jgi:mono/diheme cytochrome c family protein